MLASQDESRLLLIDYEESSLGPRSWDFASFLATTPREIDYPYSEQGACLYLVNSITERELLHYVDVFLSLEYKLFRCAKCPSWTKEEYVENERQQFFSNVVVGMYLTNVIYGIWPITFMGNDEETSGFIALAHLRHMMNKQLEGLEWSRRVLIERGC